MKKLLSTAIQFLTFLTASQAQSPQDLLVTADEKFPSQKLFLHTDRSVYVAGETVMFKAYLMNEFRPDSVSSTLNIKLVNESLKTLATYNFPLAFGYSSGSVSLPDTLMEGTYFIVSSTSTSVSNANSSPFIKSVYVISEKKGQSLVQHNSKNEIFLHFFPESGNLVQDINSVVAVKALSGDGQPQEIEGTIVNQAGEVISVFKSNSSGVGKFYLLPQEGEKYKAILKGETSNKNFNLPDVMSEGAVLRIKNSGGNKHFEIETTKTSMECKPSYMLGQLNGQVVFKTVLNSEAEHQKGIIDVSKLNSGILQITIFNSKNVPLAERITFVNNKEFITNVLIKPALVSFSARSASRFYLSFDQKITGSFSVSVTDADIDDIPEKENIISALLLTEDLKNPVHNPLLCLSLPEDSSAQVFDDIMLTNQWARFSWKQLLAKKMPEQLVNESTYITIEGNAYKKGTMTPLSEKELTVLLSSEDSTRAIQTFNTNNKGKFRLSPMIFGGKSTLIFSDNTERNSIPFDIILDTSFLKTPEINLALYSEKIKALISGNIKYKKNNPVLWKYDPAFYDSQEGKTLSAVTVKSLHKSPTQKLEEKYATGLFTGISNKTIDFVNSNQTITGNLIDYLRYNVNGITVSGTTGRYILNYRSRKSLARGPIPMSVYLDGYKTEISAIEFMPLYEVALIKVYSSFIGEAGNGAGGVLSVYTRKGDDVIKKGSENSFICHANGYSIAKQFFSPDYSKAISSSVNDNRITLYWNPAVEIMDSNISAPFTFYNNDRTKRFRIKIEGMTDSGKLVSIDKIFSAN